MRYLVITLCLMFTCGVTSLKGQQVTQPDYRTAFVVPREIGLAVVASQPDCPLQFENVMTLKYINGGTWESYQLRNRGTKPIRAYTIAWLSTGGPEWSSSWPQKIADELLLPGQAHPQDGEGTQVEIVPLTQQLHERSKLPKQMQAVNILMVVRVEFADGTVYSDEQTHKALQAYFKEIALLLDTKK